MPFSIPSAREGIQSPGMIVIPTRPLERKETRMSWMEAGGTRAGRRGPDE